MSKKPVVQKKHICLLYSIGAILLCAVFFQPLIIHAASTAQEKLRLNRITSVSYAQDEASERLTIVLEQETSYKSACLDKNTSANQPSRLYVDIYNTSLTKKAHKTFYPKSARINKIRVAEKDASTTRIVFELENNITRAEYKITQASDTHTVTIDIPIKNIRAPLPVAEKTQAPHPQTQKIPAKTVPQTYNVQETEKHAALPAQQEPVAQPAPSEKQPAQINNAVKTHITQDNTGQTVKKDTDHCVIVIDPGHGGKDPGAIGYRGIEEKDVCLAIALELKKLFDKEPRCKTILTRTADTFVSLSTRSQIANGNNADFFLSIHTNSHEDEKLTGIETYYLDFSSDADARKVAARENFTTPDAISDLEIILFDLLQSDKINKSSILAGYIHNALLNKMKHAYTEVRNLGVKHAPLRVLIDAEMPCVIIEAAFISNPAEARLLKNTDHQKLLAQAIVEGVRNFKNGIIAASSGKSRDNM